ncbi:hypothetical protein M407DRAFT_228274 [Tulasnella calospora MUT 4182]|uniref:Uncharacterized protein n=1 Tax=Tulasnella calospora MUT 4182 TaxID=1051891 RepID=A0A0C3L5Z5_9AGAM|nr:hypothetical protein M407DRAFT_228274 [Tulasnella calospora MUT 4182]
MTTGGNRQSLRVPQASQAGKPKTGKLADGKTQITLNNLDSEIRFEKVSRFQIQDRFPHPSKEFNLDAPTAKRHQAVALKAWAGARTSCLLRSKGHPVPERSPTLLNHDLQHDGLWKELMHTGRYSATAKIEPTERRNRELGTLNDALLLASKKHRANSVLRGIVDCVSQLFRLATIMQNLRAWAVPNSNK